MIPGEYKLKKEDLECNQGKETITVKVTNTDDRPIAVGSHYHFFEVNKFMSFDREATFGYSFRYKYPLRGKRNKNSTIGPIWRKPCDLRFEQFNKWSN